LAFLKDRILCGRENTPMAREDLSGMAIASTHEHESLPTASVADTLAIVSEVIVPTIAKGPIIRRPTVVGMAERLNLDMRAVRRIQQVRDKYGEGPLMLRMPGRHQAVVLHPDHVHRILNETPEPFAAANTDKIAALSHFEPHVSLISHGSDRVERRRFNGTVLDEHLPVHRMGAHFVQVVEEEARALIDLVGNGYLTYDRFFRAWFRAVRRIVFGDSAREEVRITNAMERLRASANWAYFSPKNRRLRQRLFSLMKNAVERSEPNSLARVIMETPRTKNTKPLSQIPQWLFAFDPAGMATFRALALLSTHDQQRSQAGDEIGSTDRAHLPYLRACVLESLRLWPTTPMVLRETTQDTGWEAGTMPAHTGILIFAPFFHRDDANLEYANRFAPEVWLETNQPNSWPLIPFSDGPGVCPGRNLVLLTASTMLSVLLEREVRMDRPDRLDPSEPMPGVLDNYSVRFKLGWP
jgi:cytochrome P450